MTLSSLCKKQDGSWIKICEIFSGKSLKEDLLIDATFDPCYFSWESTFKNSWNTHVVFNVRFAASQQDDPTRLVVPVLAAEVEGSKAPPVFDVEVAPGPHQHPHRLAVPLPGRLVQGCIPMLKLNTLSELNLNT